MTADFFDRQTRAWWQTVRLLVMFALAVTVIILAIYLLVALAAVSIEPRRPTAQAGPTLWRPALFIGVMLGTTLVISVGSLYKIRDLSGSGEHVALLLGGRPVNPQTTNLAERRLLNVAEEMALASGIPVPAVYVLPQEPGINAFAAGHQPGDAVVAVSAGCLTYLTREELQGVIGHEFSHIVNGDMRLNLRLLGVVFGILIVALIGFYVIRLAGLIWTRANKGTQAAAGVFIFGLALVILGYLGVLLGRLIKSAVARQREFLADASSVQFTRNPSGITGALKKIGGLAARSRIRNGHAEEISHMFFGDAFAGSFFNLFATHPPLEQRIRAFEPEFDGHFPTVQPLAVTDSGAEEPSRADRSAAFATTELGAASTTLRTFMALEAGNTPQQIGRPQVKHLCQAGQTMAGIPQRLLDAAREPLVAQGLVYALLLSRDDEATRAGQLQLLQSQIAPSLCQEAQQLVATTQSLPVAARLSLVDLAIPALRKSSRQQYEHFRQVVETLVNADGKVDLYEYCLRTVLFSYLDFPFGLKRAPVIRYRTVRAVAQPATLVLSMLAHVGQSRPDDVQRAFQVGVQHLRQHATLVPRQNCTLRTFDVALASLAQVSPKVKRKVISAVTACIAADGKVTREESELLRAIAAVLGCPMPPMAAATNGN
jgi:Zn-dependent protease with chaperone function